MVSISVTPKVAVVKVVVNVERLLSSSDRIRLADNDSTENDYKSYLQKIPILNGR